MTVTNEDIADGELGLSDDATLWDKRMQALTMKNAGATYARIAETFHIAQPTAKDWVRRAIKDVVRLPVDQMVDRQRSILLDITRVNYQRAMDPSNPEHREAQGVIIRCLEHEAKLYGLYAPTRVAVGISDGEFGQQAMDVLNELMSSGAGLGPLAEIAGLGSEEVKALAPGSETQVSEDGGTTWSNL